MGLIFSVAPDELRKIHHRDTEWEREELTTEVNEAPSATRKKYSILII